MALGAQVALSPRSVRLHTSALFLKEHREWSHQSDHSRRFSGSVREGRGRRELRERQGCCVLLCGENGRVVLSRAPQVHLSTWQGTIRIWNRLPAPRGPTAPVGEAYPLPLTRPPRVAAAEDPPRLVPRTLLKSPLKRSLASKHQKHRPSPRQANDDRPLRLPE